jgi:transketolase
MKESLSMSTQFEILGQAANQARGLAMDAVKQCHSGHLGLPLGCAEIGAVLFGQTLKVNPDEPKWINRDRFILSAGHGSMFLYAWLHLCGFDLSLEQLRNFRQLGSKTPGHPEYGHTSGVECTTGPLGQGIGNAVGMAMAAKMAEARYNTAEHTIMDHHIITLCGDGCMQEGIASEAASLAGHLGLDNLIIIYDSNQVTLDAMADKSQSEDVGMRFKAYGFDVVNIDGHDFEMISKTLEQMKAADNQRPKLIIAKTIIGKGIQEVAGTNKAHGEAGVKFIPDARKALGLPDETFYVSDTVRDFFIQRKQQLKNDYQAWKIVYQDWRQANSALAKELEEATDYVVSDNILDNISLFSPDTKLATRDAGSVVLQQIAKAMPLLVSGSADLHGSTKNYIKDVGDFSKDNPQGRNIFFGIREHAMGAIVNGFGYYGLFRPSGCYIFDLCRLYEAGGTFGCIVAFACIFYLDP